jgi:hypothetical protein
LDEFDVNGVFQVEFKGSRDTLKSTPEELSGILDDVGRREGAEELPDLIVEDVLEDAHGQFHTHLIASLGVGLVELTQRLHLDAQSGGVLSVLFLDLSQKLLPCLIET